MKKLIDQIKSHAEAAKSEPDIINHLDAIIGACGMLEQAIERNAEALELPRMLIEFTRDFHISKANETSCNAHDRDRYQYTAKVLDELLKRIEGRK